MDARTRAAISDARSRFIADVAGRADPTQAGAASFDDALARYAEPHRHYHSVAHVVAVLDAIERLRTTEPCDDPVSLRMAGLYHDVIYDPQAHDNEARSAAFGAGALGAVGIDRATIGRVERLIMMTIDHVATNDDAHVLADADLAVLGAPASVYDRYVAGVRAEYAHVTDVQWRAGRPAVLRRFLDRPFLFATPTGRRAESAARANLTRELAALIDPLGPVSTDAHG